MGHVRPASRHPKASSIAWPPRRDQPVVSTISRVSPAKPLCYSALPSLSFSQLFGQAQHCDVTSELLPFLSSCYLLFSSDFSSAAATRGDRPRHSYLLSRVVSFHTLTRPSSQTLQAASSSHPDYPLPKRTYTPISPVRTHATIQKPVSTTLCTLPSSSPSFFSSCYSYIMYAITPYPNCIVQTSFLFCPSFTR